MMYQPLITLALALDQLPLTASFNKYRINAFVCREEGRSDSWIRRKKMYKYFCYLFGGLKKSWGRFECHQNFEFVCCILETRWWIYNPELMFVFRPLRPSYLHSALLCSSYLCPAPFLSSYLRPAPFRSSYLRATPFPVVSSCNFITIDFN